MVEILVGTVILALVASGTAIALISSNRILSKGTSRTRIDALIDEDINKLKDAAEHYTYCSGSYTWNGASCNGVGPHNERYYFPVTSGTNFTAANDFATACANGTMTNALRTAMNGGDSSLALDTSAASLGITRSQVTLDDSAAHRLKVDYTAPSLTNPRRVLIIPIVAAWCP